MLGAVIAASPLSISALNSATKHTGCSGRLNLSFSPYELKLRHSFNLATSQRTTTPGVQVQIEYDGIIGYGEASMPPYLGESVASVVGYLTRLDLAQFTNPFRIEEIHDYLDTVAQGNHAAKAAVDIALHDLIGKIMGQPWHKIWGLSLDTIPHTSFTVSYDANSNEMRKKIEETAPYKIIKVKMGVGHDKELVNAIRRHTNVPICVDANQGWSKKENALEMCHWLAERNCLFVEQPMSKDALDDTAWLRERSPLPIIADEFVQRLSDIRRAAGAYDGINIKLMKCTGMHEAYQMATMARALGIKTLLGCMTETSCAISAAAQLSPIADWTDLDGSMLIANDIFDGAKLIDGKIIPTERPGIGVTPI